MNEVTGYILLACPECGHVTVRYADHWSTVRCDRCRVNFRVDRRELIPAFSSCQCKDEWRDGIKYLTNLRGWDIAFDCPKCDRPVRMRMNDSGTAYIPYRETVSSESAKTVEKPKWRKAGVIRYPPERRKYGSE